MDINTYFFDMIKVAVERKDCLSGIPTADEWKEIYKLAKQQTLIGILFSALERLPQEQRPPRAQIIQWYATTEVIKEQNRRVNADAVKICNIVHNDGMRCVVLKGQGIATYYPKPSLRQCGDIDLWIEGGSKKVIDYLRTKSEVRNIFYTHAEYDAPVGTEVEVHHHPTYLYNPLYLRRLNNYFSELNEMFDYRIELWDGSGEIFMPTVEFNRYYVLQHIYRHYFGEGIGLRQLMDYYYVLLQGGTTESKERTLKLFERTGMTKFAAGAMWVMQSVFGMEDKYLLCAPNVQAGKQLLDEVMIAGNFGQYDTRIDRTNHHKLIPRVCNYMKRNIKFLTEYPTEILFEIPMRTYMYLWKHFV